MSLRFEGLDRFGLGDLAEHFPEQFEEAYRIGSELKLPDEFEGFKPRMVFFAGMGGSAVGGDLLRDWLRQRVKVPMEVCRGYNPPAYLTEDSLVFAISYSGNTEETLSFMLRAHRLGCRIISLSSGGLMEKLSKKLRIPHVKVPAGLLPRAAIAYLSTPLIPLIKRFIDDVESFLWEVDETLDNLRMLRDRVSRRVSVEENPAKKMAKALLGKMPVVFGYGYLSSVARRFKNQLNENSKVAARWDELPELDHNEVMAYQKPEDYVKNQLIVFLRSRVEPPEFTARVEATRKVMEREVSDIYEVFGLGSSALSNMYTLLYLTDFTSIYLAYLRGVDPGDTSLIEDLKKTLDSNLGIPSKLRSEFGDGG
ncbi:MAG: phosphomannose isomerase [Candidatus Bathyarchaeota archaeon B24]|nr:MAG: phosphomannose isomerase [Candidatus Bathyarchaeota archaeon B24]